MTDGGPTFYTVAEAAGILRCSESTIRRAIREGRLGAARVRERGWARIPASAIEAMVARDQPDPNAPDPFADLPRREPDPEVDQQLLAALLAESGDDEDALDELLRPSEDDDDD